MTTFHYIAVDEQDRAVSGTVEAGDWQAAEQALIARRLREPRQTAAPAVIEKSETLGPADAADFARHLTELAKSGLPLGDGLRAIAKDLPNGRLSRAIGRLVARLEAGQSLQSAIESFGTRLPAHLRELLIAGARSGNLAQTLDEVLVHEGQVDDLSRQLRQAVGYPLILLAFLIAWLLFASFWLVPVVQLYTDWSVEVPAVARLFIEFSKFVPGAILGAVIVCLLILAIGQSARGAALVSRWWSYLPWIGPAWWYRGLVEFSGLMDVFLRQGMSLPEALRLTSLASRDAAISRACRRMADEVAQGQALSTCLAHRSLFPPTLVRTVAWGENHAALAEACRSARQMFFERLESQTELVRLVLPPMVFLLLGASGLFVAAGVFGGMTALVHSLA